MLRTLRYWLRRRRYDRYMANEGRKLDELAASPWRCIRCGVAQSSEGRTVDRWWEGTNHSRGNPRADRAAMTCRECGAYMTKMVNRHA